MQVDQAVSNLAAGVYLDNDPQVTQRKNLEILARIDTLRGLINLSYEDYKECFYE